MRSHQDFLSRAIYSKLIASLKMLSLDPKKISTHNLSTHLLDKLHSIYPSAKVEGSLMQANKSCDLLIMNLAFLDEVNLQNLFLKAYNMLNEKGFVIVSTIDYASKNLIKKYAFHLFERIRVDNLSILNALNLNPLFSCSYIQEPILSVGTDNQWINCDIFFIYKNTNENQAEESYSAAEWDSLAVDDKALDQVDIRDLSEYEYRQFEDNREFNKLTAEENLTYKSFK